MQAKEQSFMNETSKAPKDKTSASAESEPMASSKKDEKFKEVVCPNVPTSYFKRAKKQKIKY